MTENEAIKHLQSYAEVVGNMIKYCKDFEPKADITGYLEKKTVFEMAVSALKEVQKYSEIGTVEECREAVEKQKAKKPILINYKEYANKIANAEFLEDAYFCPNCKTVMRSGIYCKRCGQAIQWNENLEEIEDERD